MAISEQESICTKFKRDFEISISVYGDFLVFEAGNCHHSGLPRRQVQVCLGSSKVIPVGCVSSVTIEYDQVGNGCRRARGSRSDLYNKMAEL